MNTRWWMVMIACLALLGAACGQAKAETAVAAAPTPATEPAEVVKSFYAWFLNPTDGMADVHESPFVTQAFLEKVDQGGVNLVCAQDFPQWVRATDTQIDGDGATVEADTSFGSKVTLLMVNEGGVWKIDGVKCH